MYSLHTILIACVMICTSTAKNSTKDVIGFPEMEEDPDLKNKENRQPVYLPAMCPENELYYPGDQKDDWICDCRPAHLYHPESDSCWPAFRRGPCQEGFYLVLPQNSVIPVCEKNPCNRDTYVLWNTKCEPLGSIIPCNHLYPIPAALGVNATSLVVSCVRLSLDSRLPEQMVMSPTCPHGSRRSVNGKCIPILI